MDYAKFLKKKKLAIGDLVQINAEGREYEGYIFPQSEKSETECIRLKLKSGYNIGIKFSKISKIWKLKEAKNDFNQRRFHAGGF